MNKNRNEDLNFGFVTVFSAGWFNPVDLFPSQKLMDAFHSFSMKHEIFHNGDVVMNSLIASFI